MIMHLLLLNGYMLLHWLNCTGCHLFSTIKVMKRSKAYWRTYCVFLYLSKWTKPSFIHADKNTFMTLRPHEETLSSLFPRSVGGKIKRKMLMIQDPQSSRTSPVLIGDHRNNPVLVPIPIRKFLFPVQQPKRFSSGWTGKDLKQK